MMETFSEAKQVLEFKRLALSKLLNNLENVCNLGRIISAKLEPNSNSANVENYLDSVDI